MSVPEKSDLRNSPLFMLSADVSWLLSRDGHFHAANPESETVLGFSTHEIQGKPLADFVHPEERSTVDFNLHQLAAGKPRAKFDCRFMCKDGSYRALQCSAVFSDAELSIYCTARDVTEQRHLEKGLRDSEQRYRMLFENAAEGIFQATREGQITTVNTAFSGMLGYGSPREMMLSVSALERIYADSEDYQFACEELGRLGLLIMESEFSRRDGSVVPVNIRARVEHNVDGLVHQYFITDLTERRVLETVARAMEVKYRALIENAVYPVYRSSLDGRFLDVNHAFVIMLGYKSREEVLSLNIEQDVFQNPGDRASIIRQYSNSERMTGIVVHWKRQDGSPIAVHLSGRKVRGSTGMLEGFEFIAEEIPAEGFIPSGPRT
jgi:PAS domain S-box-containing protein